MYRKNVEEVRSRGLANIHIDDEEITGGRIGIGGRRVHNFGDCGYLGLGRDPRIAAGAKRAIDRFGTSYSSSIAYTAVPLYRDLRERIESMVDASVVLAPTTTLAHAAALPVIVRPGDVVLMDSAVHTSVQMATQHLTATGIDVETVPHGNTLVLEKMILTAEEDRAERIWYLADGVYSMSGDAAPFQRLRDLADRHDSLWLYIDDAHGFGWHGRHGRGLALARMGWHDRLVITAGLSKSFAAGGGIIAARDTDLIDDIDQCGPPLSFGGPINPATLGAGVASADIHLSEEILGHQAAFAERIIMTNLIARDLQLPLTSVDHTPVFFVEVGRMDHMTEIVERMLEDGFYVNGAMWPIVPHRHAGVRFTITNNHSVESIRSMLECLAHHHARTTQDEITIDLRGDDPVIDVVRRD